MNNFVLEKYINNLLKIDDIRDYMPNGLQIQGRDTIFKIASAVTASKNVLDAILDFNPDALLVHHGYFWNNEQLCITHYKYHRIRTLIQQSINLFAYHLPLDLHDCFGNLQGFAEHMQWKIDGYIHIHNLPYIAYTNLENALNISMLHDILNKKLNRRPIYVGPKQSFRKIAWCTGAAQDFITYLPEYGIDCYISGEISERTVHYARESGIGYFSVGHHASERYGIQKLAVHLADKFKLEHCYFECDNPV